MRYYHIFKDLYADFFPPSCDMDGYYQPVQCHFNGCYCVDKNGNVVKTFTKPRYSLTQKDCQKRKIST